MSLFKLSSCKLKCLSGITQCIMTFFGVVCHCMSKKPYSGKPMKESTLKRFGGNNAARTILFVGLWWPIVFRDAVILVNGLEDNMQHNHVLLLDPLEKWGLDFVSGLVGLCLHCGHQRLAPNGSKLKLCALEKP